jgi:hypothetical protein
VAGAEPRQAARWSAVLFAGALAAAVLSFAIPVGRALLPTLPGNPAFHQIELNRPQPEEALRRAAAGRERAAVMSDWSRFRSELAALYFTLGNGAASPATAAAYFARAIAAAEDSLARRPYDSTTWLRAAVAAQRLDGSPTRRSADFAAMSVAVQPNEALNMPARLAVVLDHWWVFTDAQRAALRGQAVAAFDAFPVEVSLLALDPRRLALLRGLMATAPQTLMRFEKQVGIAYAEAARHKALKEKAEAEAAARAAREAASQKTFGR